MTFKPRRAGLRRFEGSKIGALAQPVFVCERCGCWQCDARGFPLDRPDFYCMDGRCNGTTFVRFMSKAEAKVYASLLLRIAKGELRDLTLQPKFPLHAVGPDGVPKLVWTYISDFSVVDAATGERRIIEVKSGADTQVSEIKRKHASIQYGIEIHVTEPN